MGFTFQLYNRLLQLQTTHVNRLVGILEDGHGFFTEHAAPHAFKVHAGRPGRIPRHHHKGRHILAGQRSHSQHGIRPYMAELMCSGKAGKDDIVGHMNMPGHGGVIGKNIIVPDLTIVGYVHIGHDQIAMTDAGDALILHRTPVYGTTLAKVVVVTDFKTGGLALVFLVLTIFTDGGELKNPVALTNPGGPFNARMGVNQGAGIDFNTRADIGERPDLYIRSQFSFWINDSLRVDQSINPFLHRLYQI